MNKQELENELSNHYGTERWYKHGLNPKMLYTDGVKAFAENAGGGAYWFLDIVATELMKIHKTEEFISIFLNSTGNDATLSATDGNDKQLWSRDMDFTDCPEGKWMFYLTNNTMLLPNEY